MDQWLKKQWTTALRSGAFPQGRNVLRSTEGYCCLGVLCEVLGYESVLEEVFNVQTDEYVENVYTYCPAGTDALRAADEEELFEGESALIMMRELTPSVLASVGISDEDQCHLMAMNDSHLSFSHIARWIDNNL